MNNGKTKIEIVNLCKTFNKKKVLENLNLDIKQGETTVIIGRSGCGKSVLLKHMIGLLRPDFGQVIIDDMDIAQLKEDKLNEIRTKFGMLFQESALFDSLTVWENVGFHLVENKNAKQELVMTRVKECLELVGLKDIEYLKPSELSGGMKKRVALARALFLKPEVILYDEPTTGVDPIMADVINELIIELNQKLNVTSVAVTHDMKSAYKIADRIAMLYNGKIIEIGTPEEIRNIKNPVVQQFITGSSKGPISQF